MTSHNRQRHHPGPARDSVSQETALCLNRAAVTQIHPVLYERTRPPAITKGENRYQQAGEEIRVFSRDNDKQDGAMRASLCVSKYIRRPLRTAHQVNNDCPILHFCTLRLWVNHSQCATLFQLNSALFYENV
ncbi:hypothetical protein BaRGS_00014137 [Batillaria attramentaria]|uniref:Uncharacterized protein n=1 Tax=Batillaria attramentaria TaxID=370345 RepID=A0ABD0L6R3_9CAEN